MWEDEARFDVACSTPPVKIKRGTFCGPHDRRHGDNHNFDAAGSAGYLHYLARLGIKDE